MNWLLILREEAIHDGLVSNFGNIPPFFPLHGEASHHGDYFLSDLESDTIDGNLPIIPAIDKLERTILIISSHQHHVGQKTPFLK